jgi:hypothetical protein
MQFFVVIELRGSKTKDEGDVVSVVLLNKVVVVLVGRETDAMMSCIGSKSQNIIIIIIKYIINQEIYLIIINNNIT